MDISAIARRFAETGIELRPISSIGVITGAGISAESGIPTYRGRGGLYDDPEVGEATVMALSHDALTLMPEQTWQVIHQLRERAARGKPNAGHVALAELEAEIDEFTLLTQNIDGLHQQAGSRNVIEIHGNAFRELCMECGRAGPGARSASLSVVPRCEHCSSPMRPDVVLFGELLPTVELTALKQAFYERSPELVLVVGTSALFPYIEQPVLVAGQRGRLTIEVNTEATGLSPHVGLALHGAAGSVLPALVSYLKQEGAI